MAITKHNDVFYMSDGAGIRHDVHNGQAVDYPAHSHDFTEFIYMLHGECTHTVDQRDYLLKRGDLLIIHYGQMHSISGSSQAEFINIFLKPSYISQSLQNQNNAFSLLKLSEFADFQKIMDRTKCDLHFSGEERDTIEGILQSIESEFVNPQPGHSLSAHAWFNLFLITVFRKLSIPLTEGFEGVSDSLLLYIKQNCDRNLKLEDISRMCFYNPSYFSRIFKQFCGMSFTEYLKTVRIERAAQLIRKTSLNINAIYPQVGYSDKTKFFKHFRQIMGVTPLQYRKSKN